MFAIVDHSWHLVVPNLSVSVYDNVMGVIENGSVSNQFCTHLAVITYSSWGLDRLV